MSGRLLRYQAYRESSIEWIDHVPTDWSEVRFRFLTSITTGDKDTVNREEDGKYPFFVRSQTIEQISTYSFDGEAILTAGDGDIGKIFHHYIGRFDFHQRVYKFSNFNGLAGRFLYYYLSANLANEVVKLSAKTTVDSLRMPMLLNFKVAYPCLEEQTQIAKFLDYETAKIDALIEKQQQLIALLKEKRQAVISHAVTKGLNPDAPMRDSGVEWLGEVPAHWEVKNLNCVLTAIGDVDHYMPQSVERGIPYVMTGDLEELASSICFRDCKQVSHEDYLKLSKRIKSSKGDVIMARYATIGTVSYVDVDTDFLVSYSCVTIKPNLSIVLGMYLFYYFKSDAFLQGIQSQVNTNTQGNVGVGDLKKIKVALPTLSEQSGISEYLQSKISKLDRIFVRSQAAIDLLNERKTALISAAVTGKIDVRGWKAPEINNDVEV